MKKKLMLLLAMTTFLLSCSSESNNKESAQLETTLTTENLETETMSIELNNGEKWKVDEKMMTHIHNMENYISVFSETEQKDYKSLSDKLQTNLDLLRSGCTMEGKAHDELHKWLLPFMDFVEELSKAKDNATASNQFIKIQSSFTTFNYYFN